MPHTEILNHVATYDLSKNLIPMPTGIDFDLKAEVAEVFKLLRIDVTPESLEKAGIDQSKHPHIVEGTSTNLIDKLIEQKIVTEEVRTIASTMFTDTRVGYHGVTESELLRSWPNSQQSVVLPAIQRKPDEIPADLIPTVVQTYDDLDEETQAKIPKVDWLIHQYYSMFDQLNEIIIALKNGEYSRPHIATFTNPEFYPIPGYTPEENIILNRMARYPSVLMFTVTVNEYQSLSLNVIVREQEITKEAPRIVFKYAMILTLLGFATGLSTNQLVIHALRSYSDKEEALDFYTFAEESGIRYQVSYKRNENHGTDLFSMRLKDVTFCNLDRFGRPYYELPLFQESPDAPQEVATEVTINP